MLESLCSIDWSVAVSISDPDDAYGVFYGFLRGVLDEICPKRFIRDNRSKNCEWISEDLKRKCRTKRQMYEDMTHGLLDGKEYREYSNTLRKEIEFRKKESNSLFINNSQNKTKAVWSLVKQITSKTEQQHSDITKLEVEGCAGSGDRHVILSHINNYLIDICADMERDMSSCELSERSPHTLYLRPTTSIEIENIIYDLKATHSVGFDEIPMKLIKHCSLVLSAVLEPLINKTLVMGVFPELLKYSNIKLIHKSGDRKKLENYRPISLLSNISKIYEKVIYRRIYEFVTKYNIISNRQNAYTKNKTTTRAIYEVLEEILKGINEDSETVAVFMDLSKAFDSVNYNKLFIKLERMGIRGVTLDLIKSYLTNRKQRVVEDGSGVADFSDWGEVRRGVPQGSILGPLLFILYTNDVPLITDHLTTLYADDTSVVVRSSSGDLAGEIGGIAAKFEDWFSQNDLKLNLSKTKFVKFSYFKPEKTTVSIGGNEYIFNDYTKFLGVCVDSQLNWREHIDGLARGVSGFAYALRTVVSSIDRAAALTAYYSYVESRLRYGIVIWGASGDVSRLFVLQKMCIRSIFGLGRRDSCRLVFMGNDILTLPCLYVLECALFVRANYDLFENQVIAHGYGTRGAKCLHMLPPQTKKSLVSRSALTQVIRIYNHLPLTIRNAPKVEFKRLLRRLLVSRGFYTVHEFLEYRF